MPDKHNCVDAMQYIGRSVSLMQRGARLAASHHGTTR